MLEILWAMAQDMSGFNSSTLCKTWTKPPFDLQHSDKSKGRVGEAAVINPTVTICVPSLTLVKVIRGEAKDRDHHGQGGKCGDMG